MKALIAIAAVGVALFTFTSMAGAAAGSDGTGLLAKPDAVGRWGIERPSPRFWVIQPSPRTWGSGVVQPNPRHWIIEPNPVRWGVVQPNPRQWIIEPNPRGFGVVQPNPRLYGPIGRGGVVRPNAAGFRW